MAERSINMDSVLIVSAPGSGRQFIDVLSKSHLYGRLENIPSGGDARRRLLEDEFDLIVINTPLSDETGIGLALHLSVNTDSGVLLMVKGEIQYEVADKVEEYGVLVASKPVGRQVFFQSLRLLTAARRRTVILKTENIKLQHKIDEIRLVDRAKCALIQYLSLTEQQAHRYIEKQSMDSRKSRRETAEQILKTYEM